jgi:signal transduction histidine kinase
MVTVIEDSNIKRNHRLSRQVALVRWIVPPALSIFVLVVEALEHLTGETDQQQAHREYLDFSFEVFFFGVIGPILIFAFLTRLSTNLKQLALAYEEIRSLNTDLEARIEVRTAELASANDELRQLDQLKSEFVSLVSHELRAPLTNIHGGIELALHKLEPCAEPSHNILKIVQSEVDRLTKLVKHILDVSALQAGRLQLNRGLVALRPLISAVTERHLASDENKHHFKLEIPAHLPPVWADEDRLADVLANLINNAIKYSPNGGEICINAHADNNCIHLRVIDQGVGIPLSTQDRLFQPFYRVDNAQDSNLPGYGLGLYFCYKLIEAQKGRIWVESVGEAGKGTTIHMTLPVDNSGGIL